MSFEEEEIEEQLKEQERESSLALEILEFDLLSAKKQKESLNFLLSECQGKFDERIVNHFLKVIDDNSYNINLRAESVRLLGILNQKHKLNKFHQKLEKIVIKNLNINRRKKAYKKYSEEEITNFRLKIFTLTLIIKKISIETEKKFIEWSKIEKNEKVRLKTFEVLADMNIQGNLKHLFHYMINDTSFHVRNGIHIIFFRRVGAGYEWKNLSELLTEEVLDKIFSEMDLPDVKKFIIIIGRLGNPNKIYEKHFLKILKESKGDIELRKTTASYIGNIGFRKSIIELSSLSKHNATLKKNALGGLNALAVRYNTTREKLVEEHYHSLKKHSYVTLSLALH